MHLYECNPPFYSFGTFEISEAAAPGTRGRAVSVVIFIEHSFITHLRVRQNVTKNCGELNGRRHERPQHRPRGLSYNSRRWSTLPRCPLYAIPSPGRVATWRENRAQRRRSAGSWRPQLPEVPRECFEPGPPCGLQAERREESSRFERRRR